MSAWSTSGMVTGRRSAATRPANPRPTGIRALLDLLLDPLRGARAQHLAPSEQQDRDVSTAMISVIRCSSSCSSSSSGR